MRETLQRAFILFLTCALAAGFLVDWSRVPQAVLRVGDVAPRTIKTPVAFKFQDVEAFEDRRIGAKSSTLPVFVYQPDLKDELLIRTRTAFANARAMVQSTPNNEASIQELSAAIREQLQRDTRVHLVPEDVASLVRAEFNKALERFVIERLGDAMGGMVVADRAQLRGINAIRVLPVGDESNERVLKDLDQIQTATEVRQQISLQTLDSSFGTLEEGKAGSAFARSMIRANLTYSPLKTVEHQKRAVESVRLAPESVKRGTVLFREGDTLSARDVLIYRALQAQQGEKTKLFEWGSVTVFLLLFILTVLNVGSMDSESPTSKKDLASAGVLFILAMAMARITTLASFGISELIGFEATAESVWFLAPIAGSVMLVRLLMGMRWSLLFTIVVAVSAGMVMEMRVLPTAFFLISGLAATASINHTRERIAVLRAGLGVALVNATTVLLIHFVQLYVVDGEITAATTMRPVWSMAFALTGGIVSAFLVLGLTPLFETVGFVTDYRLMELANLNHPLMRQLMLRAPGSYHHSVMVGSLAEAAAEAIGANALQAKVSAYFHDIGKTLKPQFFVENQGNGGNRHTNLDPYTSAQIIISHVTEGGRLAVEHNLPKPIVDNIWMHHGTGILQYFYAKASADGEVDDTPFRYPGPKPSTREAGIIMLADKVEAATRTIRVPDEHNIRSMISRIVNSVMADGQFSECPLTFQEIHTIADTFVMVLLAVYHQRIEYPQTADLSRGPTVPKEALITLEIPPRQDRPPHTEPVEPELIPQGEQQAAPVIQTTHRRRYEGEGDELPPPTMAAPGGMFTGDDIAMDYESVQNLPGSDE